MPRHSPYALINLITIFCYPNLMRFFSIKSSMTFFRHKKCHHIIQFSKNFFEREHSFKTKQNFFYSTSFVFFFLHRKEVIHPHVLVGIPCYDFTPITCPTLNGPLLYRLGYHIRVLQTFVAWRAVCTTPGNVFTLTFWFRITSDSNFMKSSCRLQSELRPTLEFCSPSRVCFSLYWPL